MSADKETLSLKFVLNKYCNNLENPENFFLSLCELLSNDGISINQKCFILVSLLQEESNILSSLNFKIPNSHGLMNIYTLLVYAKVKSFEKIESFLAAAVASLDIMELHCLLTSLEYIKVSHFHKRPLKGTPLTSLNFDSLKVLAESAFNMRITCQLNHKSSFRRNDERNYVFLQQSLSPLLNNTGTKLILDYTFSILREDSGANVVILVTNHSAYSNSIFSIGSVRFNAVELSEFIAKYDYDKDLSNRITIEYLDARVSLDEFLDRYNPKFIITTEYASWPFLDALSGLVKVNYLSLLSGLLPDFKVERAILPKPEIKIKNKNASTLSFVNYIYNFSDFKIERQANLGSKADRIITVAVNLLDRVERIQLAKFFDTMIEFLTNNPSFRWELLGVELDDLKSFFSKNSLPTFLIDKKRIFAHSFVNDFDVYIKSARAIVHPPLLGGGRGIAEAVKQDLIPLCYKHTDAANFLSEEYLYQDFEELKDKLSYLSNNTISKRKLRTLFTREYNESAIHQFLNALKEA